MKTLKYRLGISTAASRTRLGVGVLLVLSALFLISPSASTQRTVSNQSGQSSMDMPVRPNPLVLVLTVRPDSKITLNGDDVGSVNDTAPMAKRLADLFKYRTQMGVFRLGTTEIEKSVIVRAAPSIRYGELVKVVDAALEAGASPVGLATDEKKAPLDANVIPEVRRRDVSPEEEVKPPAPGSIEAQIDIRKEIVSSDTLRGSTAIVERVMRNAQFDPDTIRGATVVEVKANGEFFVDRKRVGKTSLYQELQNRFKDSKEEDRKVYLVGDGELEYGHIVEAINEIWETSPRMILVTGSVAPVSGSPGATESSSRLMPIILAIFAGLCLIAAAWFMFARMKR